VLNGAKITDIFTFMEFETLSLWADEELKALLKVLPQDIQDSAAEVAVSLEKKPGLGLYDTELEGDELGLFEGPSVMEESDAGELPRIRLFLMNLWQWVGKEEHDFRDEVGATFLHELGHYLGWDEDEIAQRGLE
jgi:predicted Zn-dependent protease with MMP-like domain